MKTILTLFLIALGTSAFAGTGVGNGDVTARNEYIRKLKAQLQPSPRIQAGDLGDANQLSQWCSRVAAILRRERRVAMNLIAEGKLDSAEETLLDAMTTAAQSIEIDPDSAKPITKSLLDRGLVIAQTLDEMVTNGERINAVSKLNFLVDYLDLTLRITLEVDEPLFVPYIYRFHRCHHGCDDGRFDMKMFERQYLGYAREQLEFTYEKLTEIRGDGMVLPVGNARVYLKVAELVSAWVRDDVEQNLFADRHACSIDELDVLAQNLYDYNESHSRRVYRNDMAALYLSRQALEWVAADLAEQSCHFHYEE